MACFALHWVVLDLWWRTLYYYLRWLEFTYDDCHYRFNFWWHARISCVGFWQLVNWFWVTWVWLRWPIDYNRVWWRFLTSLLRRHFFGSSRSTLPKNIHIQRIYIHVTVLTYVDLTLLMLIFDDLNWFATTDLYVDKFAVTCVYFQGLVLIFVYFRWLSLTYDISTPCFSLPVQVNMYSVV